MAAMPQPPYPIHPSMKDRVHPEYAAFYNEHIIDKQQVHYQPVAASRVGGKIIPGGGPLLPVGNTDDYAIKRRESEGPDVKVRCFTPEGPKPAAGWPVFVYYHGGGWVLGNIDTENTVCTNICKRARCVVVTVDYRLAPEHPYPAAVQDSWEAVLWIQHEGRDLLDLDLSKIATGGSSAGGNLASIMAQKAVARGAPQFLLQILLVPVTDNTAHPGNNETYKENEFTPALPAEKMIWYRKHYLPNEQDWAHPEASPLRWEGDWAQLPPAVIVVGELDVLRSEGQQFGKKLEKAGVPAEVHVMKGMPHPFLAMDGVLEAGRQAITIMVEGCKRVFGS